MTFVIELISNIPKVICHDMLPELTVYHCCPKMEPWTMDCSKKQKMLRQCDFLGHWSFKISTIRAGFQAQGGLEMTFKASKTVKGMDAMPALQQRVPNMKLHTFEFFESISDFLLPCHVMLVATMAHRNVSASHTSFIIPSTIQSLITTSWFWFCIDSFLRSQLMSEQTYSNAYEQNVSSKYEYVDNRW